METVQGETKFTLETNIEFQATDHADAYRKLAQFFDAISKGEEPETFFRGTFNLWLHDPLLIPWEAKE